MQKSVIKSIPDIRINRNKRGFSVFAKVSNKSKKDGYLKRNINFLKDSIINANKQREYLTNAIEELKSKIYLTQLFRVFCLITLIYFLKPINKRIKKRLINLDILKKKFIDGKNLSFVNLDFELDEKANKKYLLLIDMFKKLAESECIWNVNSKTQIDFVRYRSCASSECDLSKTDLSLKSFPGIKSSFQSCYFENKSGPDIYIYPCFALICKSKNNFEMIDIRKLSLIWVDENFVEYGLQPKDGTVIEYVWDKSNKDGSRDYRYSDNKQIPLMKYGQFKFEYNGDHLGEFMFSNYKSTSNLFNVFITFTDDSLILYKKRI